jgi:hypothetical protein
MRPFLVVLTLAGSACDPCGPGAAPSLTIGVGETDFAPLDAADPSWPLVYGPQGGWHIPVAIQATGLDASQIVTVDMSGTIDGVRLARVDGAWNQLRCDPDAGALEAWNLILEFTEVDTSCPLDDERVHVEVAVEDVRGERITAETEGRIDDPIHDEVCAE